VQKRLGVGTEPEKNIGAVMGLLFDDQLPRILEVNGKPTGLLSYADEAKKIKK